MTNYKIISATDSTGELAINVTGELKNGWQVTGGVAAIPKTDKDGKAYTLFFQAMVR
jgi:hypothetical protein